MKSLTKVVAGVALSLPLLAIVPAFAQRAPAPPAPGSTFAQRLEQRKREQQITLIKRDSDRLTQRCTNVQGTFRQLQQDTGRTVSKRNDTYQKIDGKLWVAIGQLKLAGKDTFKLEKQRGELAGKAAAFQSTASQYQQTLDDLLVINCQADITGFKALLETARAYYGQVRTQSADVRTYVLDNIKPSLADFVSQLQPNTGGGQ